MGGGNSATNRADVLYLFTSTSSARGAETVLWRLHSNGKVAVLITIRVQLATIIVYKIYKLKCKMCIFTKSCFRRFLDFLISY